MASFPYRGVTFLRLTGFVWLWVGLWVGLVPSSQVLAQVASFAPLVKAQREKVVHISTRASEENGDEDSAFPFRSPDQFQGMGSGFIVSADGLILTNYHVIQDAEEIEVHLENEQKFKGEIVGLDARTDLALIRIPAKKLPFVNFGDSSTLEVGDWVVAIGNPLGLDYSVTAGIISAKGRNIFDAENVAYGEFLQTDAAINPGNSGGPLFNLKGQVIGVNTAISSRGQGIGFAVPSNLVVDIIRQLRENGRVIRGWLGVVIQEVTPDWAVTVGLKETTRGILVNDVVPGAPAAKSNLQKGDVILNFGPERLKKVPQLQKMVALTPPGKEVLAQILRLDKESNTWKQQPLTITIGRAPDERIAISDGDPVDRLDITLGEVPDRMRKKLGLDPGLGVLVEKANPEGLGAEIGIKEGDVILEVDRQEVETPEDLARFLRKNRRSRISLLIQRQRSTLYLNLPQWD